MKTINYSDAVAEIEAILARLESGESDIDALASEIERATVLISECKKRLKGVEEQVEKLLSKE